MAAITVTAARVAPIFPRFAEIYSVVLAETVTKGQVLYQTSSGTYGVADANAAGKQQARGIALEGGGAGQGISMLKQGHCAGYTLSQAYDAQLFLSDTAGAADDAAGTMTVAIGRVVPMSDADKTKVVYFDFDWRVQHS